MIPKTLTCVLVDDEQSNLDVLGTYVNQIPYLVLKATFIRPLEALAYLLKTPTDLLITDISMPRLSGIDLYESLRSHGHIQVIFVSGHPKRMMEAIQYTDGVVDYLPKPVSQKRFVESILKAKISNRISVEDLSKVLENIEYLSVTQRRVFQFIASQLSTQQIADKLFISLKTAENHRHSIRKKLGLGVNVNLNLVALLLSEKIKIDNECEI